jgi:hypothetical protein
MAPSTFPDEPIDLFVTPNAVAGCRHCLPRGPAGWKADIIVTATDGDVAEILLGRRKRLVQR